PADVTWKLIGPSPTGERGFWRWRPAAAKDCSDAHGHDGLLLTVDGAPRSWIATEEDSSVRTATVTTATSWTSRIASSARIPTTPCIWKAQSRAATDTSTGCGASSSTTTYRMVGWAKRSSTMSCHRRRTGTKE